MQNYIFNIIFSIHGLSQEPLDQYKACLYYLNACFMLNPNMAMKIQIASIWGKVILLFYLLSVHDSRGES